MDIAVITDRADAEALRAAGLADIAVLPLTPVARAAVQGVSAALVDPLTRFTDFAQARTVVVVARARRRLLGELGSMPGTTAVHREIVLDLFNRMAPSAWRLWHTLGGTGPWLVWSGTAWTRYSTRAEAHAALLTRMLNRKVAEEHAVERIRLPPLPSLYRRLRRWTIARARARRDVVLVGAAKGHFGLIERLRRNGAAIVFGYIPAGGWHEYARLLRSAWRMNRANALIQTALLPQPTADGAAMADRLIAAIDDPIIRTAFAWYRPRLVYNLARVDSGSADAMDIVRVAQPTGFASSEISRLGEWLLAQACGRSGIPRAVAGRNSHAPGAGRLADDTASAYYEARFPAGLADRHWLWSPHALAVARQTVRADAQAAILPFRGMTVAPLEPRAATGTRTVLFADTFAAWWFPHLFQFQSSDETIAGLQHLAAAMAGIPDCRLVIRGKHKHECDLASLQALVPVRDMDTIKMREGSFADDLAAADLLVSFRSTVCEEALHARKPVLLWGGTARSRFLPAQTTVPSAGRRSAVYAVDRAENLRAMIEAILAVHVGQPLTDDELAPHVLPRDVPDLDTMTAAFFASPHRAEERRVPA